MAAPDERLGPKSCVMLGRSATAAAAVAERESTFCKALRGSIVAKCVCLDEKVIVMAG